MAKAERLSCLCSAKRMCGKTGKAFSWSRECSGRRCSGKCCSCSDEMSDLRLTLTKTCMDLTFDDHSVLKVKLQ